MTVFFLLIVKGSPGQSSNSLLWKVSGNGVSQPSYLLGTMHMICGEDFEIKPKLMRTLEQVKTITFEADIDNMEGSEKLMELMKPLPGILDGLTPEKKTELDSLLRDNQLTSEALNYTSPFGLMSLLTVKAIDCSDPSKIKMMERELADYADQHALEQDHLESVDFQISMIRSMNTIEELLTTIRSMKEAPKYMTELAAVYKSENLEELNAMMNDPKFMTALQQTRLLNERNKNWLKIIPGKMKAAPNLFAVGAGHLGGDNGLINLLKQKGYTVVPVL